MKVIILCGGIGTRLKEETEFKPKPMVYIGNKPMIWHIMKIYSHYGFNEFVLALGYKGEQLKDYFTNNPETSEFKTTFVDTGLHTLIGERILLCKNAIPKSDTSFMVTYGDGVADINIKKLAKHHTKMGTIGSITGVHPRSKYGLVRTSETGHVTEIVEKPMLDDWVNGGFMIFQKEYFSFLKAGEMEHPSLQRIAKKGKLALYKHKGFWFGMDTFKEFEELNQIWNSGKAPWKVWK